jgi:hypothetical protein
MLGLADLASSKGDEETARRIYELLSSDARPDIRAEAMYRRAQRLVERKQIAAAATLLRAVLDDQPDATRVRLELAGLLHQLGQDENALRQLRSAQARGLPPDVARLVDRYSQAIRATRPFGASIEIALAPDSNPNRSTSAQRLDTVLGPFSVDEDSRAESGLGLSVRAQAFRRIHLGTGAPSVLFRGALAADLYKKPAFQDIALEVAAGPEFAVGRGRLNLEVAGTERRYGTKPYMRSARVGLSWLKPVGRLAQVQFVGSIGRVDHQRNDLQDGSTLFARAKFERALSETMGAAVSLTGERHAARDPAYATSQWRAGLLLWRDLRQATVTLESEFGLLKADDRLALLPKRRVDRYSALSLGMTLRRLAFRSFAPVARLTLERNRSSVAMSDYRRTRTEIGLVRAF